MYTNTGEGLHRFVDPVDQEVYLYSQFEVPDARRVFAVFEQPDLKATFQFTVKAPKDWAVISNSPTPDPVDGVWTFAPTLDPVVVRHRAHRWTVRRRVLRADLEQRPRHPARDLRPQVPLPVPRRRLHLRQDPRGLRVLREALRVPVPVREVRPALRARVQRRRHGERGRDHVHGDVCLPVEGDRRDQGAPGRHDPARARPHVVRRPRDHEVVERPAGSTSASRSGPPRSRPPRPPNGTRRGPRSRRWRRPGRTGRTSCRPRIRSSPRSTTSRTCRSTSTASPTRRAARSSSSSSRGSGSRTS